MRKTYPYDCFAMTTYQSLRMALVYLLFHVLKNLGLKNNCDCNLNTQNFDETEVLLPDDFLVSETQQFNSLSC